MLTIFDNFRDILKILSVFHNFKNIFEMEILQKLSKKFQNFRILIKNEHIFLTRGQQNKFKMKTAVGESGNSIICRFQGIIFTLKTVYHREQELMAELIDPKTKMLSVRPNAKSEAEELKTQIRPKLAILLSRLSTIEMAVCRLFRKEIRSNYFSIKLKRSILKNRNTYQNAYQNFVSNFSDRNFKL